jgi:pyruvate,water dikinase
MKFTAKFESISKKDVGIAGGKGASLGEMTQVGIPVPPGFVILAPAFDEFLKVADLDVELDAILDHVDHAVMHQIDEASERIKALIMDKEIPLAMAEEIQGSFKELDAEFVAVRSSATSEDSADAAWAGQLNTYLNTTEEKLLKNVKKCWASLFTPRAIFYRFEKGLHGKPISVAVVVQKMIQSEVSGIAFSVHPVTQDYDQLIIEAGFGLGEAIVSGSITPDSFVIEKNKWMIIDKNITTQERGLFRKSEGGNEWLDIPTDKGERSTLTDDQVIELAKLVVKIEKHYGFPVDVEWAREGGNFYITQSRPITTLKR